MAKKPKQHPLWSVVKKTKAEGARYDGYWIVWLDRNGARRMTYAGRRRETAVAVLKRKRADIDEKRFTDFAATVILNSI